MKAIWFWSSPAEMGKFGSSGSAADGGGRWDAPTSAAALHVMFSSGNLGCTQQCFWWRFVWNGLKCKYFENSIPLTRVDYRVFEG